jgi:hypothetical protein
VKKVLDTVLVEWVVPADTADLVVKVELGNFLEMSMIGLVVELGPDIDLVEKVELDTALAEKVELDTALAEQKAEQG